MGQDHGGPRYTPEQIAQLTAWDREHVWHPFTQMQDYQTEPSLIFSHGEGAYLYDVHGKKYFDANSSLWVNIHGHCRREINEAIQRQLETLAHSTLLGPANVPSIELAKKLVDVTPAGLNKVFYSDNGSTAVEVGLKMAFQYWLQNRDTPTEKLRFIKFENAYHGDTIGSVSVGGIDLFHGAFKPLLFECHSVPYPVYSSYTSGDSPETVYGPSLEACEKIMRSHPGEVPAVIIEPLVQGAAGMRTCTPGFLRSLRELCTQHGVFLILDEVFTGFGRTGAMFACEHEGVIPDIMAISKGLTAGYLPLSVTMATDEIYSGFLGSYPEFKTFFHGHSYTGNQIGCATALAGLALFEKDQTIKNLQPKIAHLKGRFDRLFADNDKIKEIRQCGFVAGIEICPSRSRGEEYNFVDRMGAKLCLQMREKGIWIRPLGNSIILVPPLITTKDEIDYLIDTLEECLMTFDQ
jgi:adenosylmethionine---8-amino-7-oxononanoate aminotransferase